MIIGILGLPGSGKTCMATRLVNLEKQLHPYKKIYSNYHLNGLDYDLLDFIDIFINHRGERNMILLGDEISTFLDCRVSGSGRNRVESYLLKQTRKKGCDIIFTDQFEGFVDLRLSKFCNLRIIMENKFCLYKFWLNCKHYAIKKPHPYLFRATYEDNDNHITKERVFDGRKWFDKYDTYQEIYPPEDYIPKKLIKQYNISNKEK